MRVMILLVFFACLQGIVVGDLKIGTCGRTMYYIEKSSCDIQFVISMNESSNAFAECPTYYKNAHDCFKAKILDSCFEEDDSQKHDETIQFLEEEFGSEDHFCEEGLLISMKSVMESVNLSKCEDIGSKDYARFEGKFIDVFKEEFKKPVANFTRLKLEYSFAKIDQSLLAQACAIPYSERNLHFYDADEFNPYDSQAIEKVKELANKIEHGEEVEKPNTTAITIVLVLLVIVILIAVSFFFLWRRDKSRAEIRRQKRESRKQQKNGDAELQPLPASAVAQTSDEVGSA